MKNTILDTVSMDIEVKVITMDMMLGITIRGNHIIPIKMVVTIIILKIEVLLGFQSNKHVTMVQIPVTT